MIDPTVELSQKDERDWQAERQEEIAAICWQKCKECNGHGYTGPHHWEAEDAGPDYIFQTDCGNCDHTGHIQRHDPQRVEALYDAADDARERMGVECYTRIAKALALAIEGAGFLSSPATIASQTVEGKVYTITYPEGCDCYDAYYRAPKIGGRPACKHQVAVWLVKTAERKMVADTQFIREEKGYD